MVRSSLVLSLLATAAGALAKVVDDVVAPVIRGAYIVEFEHDAVSGFAGL